MPKYSRPFLTTLIISFFALKAQSQITGIKIFGDTCNSFTLDLQALGTSSSPISFGILTTQQVVLMIQLQ